MKFEKGPARRGARAGKEIYRACGAERVAPRRRRSTARMRGADRITEERRRKELA